MYTCECDYAHLSYVVSLGLCMHVYVIMHIYAIPLCYALRYSKDSPGVFRPFIWLI
jgi:hypothetical protein